MGLAALAIFDAVVDGLKKAVPIVEGRVYENPPEGVPIDLIPAISIHCDRDDAVEHECAPRSWLRTMHLRIACTQITTPGEQWDSTDKSPNALKGQSLSRRCHQMGQLVQSFMDTHDWLPTAAGTTARRVKYTGTDYETSVEGERPVASLIHNYDVEYIEEAPSEDDVEMPPLSGLTASWQSPGGSSREEQIPLNQS